MSVAIYMDNCINAFRTKTTVPFAKVHREGNRYAPGQVLKKRMERILRYAWHLMDGLEKGTLTVDALPPNYRGPLYPVFKTPAPMACWVIKSVFQAFELEIVRTDNDKLVNEDPEDRDRWVAGTLWQRIKALDVHVGDAKDIVGLEKCEPGASDASYICITRCGVFFTEGSCVSLLPGADVGYLGDVVGSTAVWFRAIRPPVSRAQTPTKRQKIDV
jgi:hypothetical protein